MQTAAEPVYAQVHKTPPVSTDYTDNRQLQPEIQAPSAASFAPVKSVTEQRRYSGSQVVIPSTEGLSFMCIHVFCKIDRIISFPSVPHMLLLVLKTTCVILCAIYLVRLRPEMVYHLV